MHRMVIEPQDIEVENFVWEIEESENEWSLVNEEMIDLLEKFYNYFKSVDLDKNSFVYESFTPLNVLKRFAKEECKFTFYYDQPDSTCLV